MHELAFPVAAVGLVFLLLIPALTLMSKVTLTWIRRQEKVWARFGSSGVLVLLMAPSALPLLWLLSSALHQSESSRVIETCLIDQLGAQTCLDALYLSIVLAMGLMLVAIHRARREMPTLSLRALPIEHELTKRIASLVSSHPVLGPLRIQVVHHADEPIFTSGWFFPRCYLDACFVRSADDSMLVAALLHEGAHINGFDNFRCFWVRFTFALNPLAFLLWPEFLRWRQAREALCDNEAVQKGGEALALAQSIVHAAKFRCKGALSCGISCLSGGDASALRLRVALLMAGEFYPIRSRGHVVFALALAGALIAPHWGADAFFDSFHLEVERWMHSRL